jgi:regulation of enolase protein 1 (concanavalin A-like superfamily)
LGTPLPMPPSLVPSAVRHALSAIDGGAVPPRVAELASGALAEMTRQRLLTPLAVVLALAVLAGGFPLVRSLAPQAVADETEQPEPRSSFTFSTMDPFDGKLRLNWKPVRPDATHVSLTRNKGKLTITTQEGTIHADETANKSVKAKNIYLIDNPLADDVDFEMSVAISGFTPKEAYQQAGLIAYDDDDNYVKFGYDYNWRANGGAYLCMVREVQTKTEHNTADAPKDAKKVWLRLTRRKDKYEYASSADGRRWTVHGEESWRAKAPAKLGFLAKNGGTKATEVDVCFEQFRLRAPAPPKAKD